MKINALALAVCLAAGVACISPPACATGIPVVDAAHIAEAVKQYEEMVKQLSALQAQLNQAKQQYASITGSRGLGDIMREDYTQSVPRNWQETLQAMNGGQVGELAKSIAQQASQLEEEHFQDVAESIRVSLQAGLESDATAQALNSQIYDNSGNRFARLQALMGQINSTSDLKAVGDLQARLQVESAMLSNELIKLQAMNAMLAKRDDLRQDSVIQESRRLRSTSY